MGQPFSVTWINPQPPRDPRSATNSVELPHLLVEQGHTPNRIGALLSITQTGEADRLWDQIAFSMPDRATRSTYLDLARISDLCESRFECCVVHDQTEIRETSPYADPPASRSRLLCSPTDFNRSRQTMMGL